MKKTKKAIQAELEVGTTICTVSRVVTDDGIFIVVRGKSGELISRKIPPNKRFEVSVTGNSRTNTVDAEVWLTRSGDK